MANPVSMDLIFTVALIPQEVNLEDNPNNPAARTSPNPSHLMLIRTTTTSEIEH
jgi:hypothetical protein